MHEMNGRGLCMVGGSGGVQVTMGGPVSSSAL